MNTPQLPTLPLALSAYNFGAEVVGAVPYGHGHVNNTFCVYTQTEKGECVRYILQRISDKAFKNPAELMENICGVTDYLREIIVKNGGDTKRETLTVIKTIKGESFYTDEEGRAWRMYSFIEDAVTLDKADTPELFYASGKAFGNFQRLLTSYPADTLHETIKDFHNTVKRLENLKIAIKEDRNDRVKNIAEEIEFALSREEDCSLALNALKNGILPLRVTHNDTKLNNVMIDNISGEGICVIDLDTVMPGLSINDFGDSIRFGANNSAEDETDLSKVNFDISLFKIYTKGFLEGCGGTLTKAEIEYLPLGAKLMTLECGIRFLTDYLDGDVYFKTTRENQNLDRARTQFKLVADMENSWDEMKKAVSKYL